MIKITAEIRRGVFEMKDALLAQQAFARFCDTTGCWFFISSASVGWEFNHRSLAGGVGEERLVYKFEFQAANDEDAKTFTFCFRLLPNPSWFMAVDEETIQSSSPLDREIHQDWDYQVETMAYLFFDWAKKEQEYYQEIVDNLSRITQRRSTPKTAGQSV